jgi:hypothetical protein
LRLCNEFYLSSNVEVEVEDNFYISSLEQSNWAAK